jgi:hypothetical protein
MNMSTNCVLDGTIAPFGVTPSSGIWNEVNVRKIIFLELFNNELFRFTEETEGNVMEDSQFQHRNAEARFP